MIIDVYIPIWDGQVTIFTNPKDLTKKSLTKSFKSYPLGNGAWIEDTVESVINTCKEEKEDKDWTGALCISNDNIGVILLSKFNDSGDSWSSLTHEVLHYVFDLLESKGVVYSRESEEAYTYLMGYIIKKFKQAYDESR